MVWALLLALSGCWGDNAYILEGTVLERTSETEVVVKHEEIAGLMGPMTMPFSVRDPSTLEGVEPGDRIYARLRLERDGTYLAKVRVTGKGEVPASYAPMGPGPLRPAERLARTELPLVGGGTLVLGEGQVRPAVLTFLYTTCPIPEFCPATVARLQQLQPKVKGAADIVAVTLDPDGDTPEVLTAYAEAAGADPAVWRFARIPKGELAALAARAALQVMEDGEEIAHGVRLLVLDADGRLVERYDDNRWPLARVVEQLSTGGPPAPPGSSGTATPEP